MVLFAAIVVTSCSVIGAPKTKPESTTNRIGVELREKNALYNRQFTFQLKEKETFAPEIRLINDTPDNSMYRLLFLLDFKQVAVKYNNELRQSVSVDTAARSAKQLKVELSDLPAGRHDLIVVAVKDPERHLTTAEYVNPVRTYIYRRVTLIVGDDTVRRPVYEPFAAEPSDSKQTGSVFMTEEPAARDNNWLTLFKYDGEAYANFRTKPGVDHYAMTVLINGEQGGQTVRYIQKADGKDGVISLPVKLDGLQQGKPNEVLVLVTENPFERVEDTAGNYMKLPWTVQFSNKITAE